MEIWTPRSGAWESLYI